MSEKLVKVRDDEQARIVTFNRPDKRNALNVELLLELQEVLENTSADPKVRTVILAGEGKGFSAGIDLMSLAAFANINAATFRHMVRRMQALANLIASMEKPVVAVLHSFCFGMASELAVACDVRIAEAGTNISMAEVRLGLIPDVGGCTRTVRIIGLPRAKELVMTGKTISAETALGWGLVNEVVEQGQGLAAALRWHEQFRQGAPLAVGLAKILMDRAYDIDDSSSMTLEIVAQTTLLQTEDVKEGVMAKFEKRAPNWKAK